MQIHGHDIGVCSWSLRPANVGELIRLLQPLGLQYLQLALGDIIRLDDRQQQQQLDELRAAGLKLTATMISFPGEDYSSIASIRATGGYVPDDAWPLRRRMTEQAARLTADLGVKYLSTHIGFVPHAPSPAYFTMAQRVMEIADLLAGHGISLLMETGQESAPALLEFLSDLSRPNVLVNFDPANMLLYGAGDPIAAIGLLGPHIRHVHVKDAIASDQPMVQWGKEMPFGRGQVPPKAFLEALHTIRYAGPLVIECEAGADRAANVRQAVSALQTAFT